MSHPLASPPPVVSSQRPRGRWWDDPDSRSVAMGVVGVVLVHLLLFLVGPFALNSGDTPSVLRPHSSSSQFNIELEPAEAEEETPPSNFVEANPDAPDNVPDKTNNFAAQNQQVAQEKPTPDGTSDRPATEGRTDIESTQIVSGSLTQPLENTPPSQPSEPADAVQTPRDAPQREQIPFSGFEKTEGESEDGMASNVGEEVDDPQPVAERVDGMKDVPFVEGATGTQPRIDPKNPRPRPQVVKQQQVRPAIFQENKFGTRNVGLAAWDAKWSNYGQYLQKIIDTVQIQWERILYESRIYPTSGTTVKVVFVLNSKGEIARIVTVEGTAGNQAEKSCASAITARAPYGPWTDDMLAVLGEEQELTFNFFYQ